MRIPPHGHAHGHTHAPRPHDATGRGARLERSAEKLATSDRTAERETRAERRSSRDTTAETAPAEASGPARGHGLHRGRGRGRGHAYGHALAAGEPGLRLSVGSRIRSDLAGMQRAERGELREFRDTLRAAAASGLSNADELAAAAPEVLQRLADYVGRDLSSMIADRLSLLQERFGTAPATEPTAAEPLAQAPPADPTAAEVATPEASSAETVADADTLEPVGDELVGTEPVGTEQVDAAVPAESDDGELAVQVKAFAERLHSIFSAFQADSENLLSLLESFLDSSDEEAEVAEPDNDELTRQDEA